MSQSDSSLNKVALNKKVSRWVRPDIQALTAYAIPNSENLLKLDAMENPYSWPEEMTNEWLNILKDVSINRYPDPNASDLKQVLRHNMNIPESMDLILGNGSDELIQIILMALNKPGQIILSPHPSFVMYNLIATYAGMQYVGVPLKSNFELDLNAMKQAIEQHHPAVIFIAYPNNPTGNLFNRNDIIQLLEATAGLMVIDEAYHAFADHSFMSDLEHYDNLLIMRTVSKMGLAGLRLGILAGHSKWLSEFNKIRLPYNINVLTQKSAEFALNHSAILAEQTRNICSDRDELLDELNHIHGLTIYPSKANFILFRTPEGTSLTVFNALKSAGILVKYLGSANGSENHMLRDTLRVTIGTDEENKRFLCSLSGIIDTLL